MRMFIIAMFAAMLMARLELVIVIAVFVYLYTVCVNRDPWNKFCDWLTAPMAKKVQKEDKSEESGYQGFTLTKDVQERNCKRFLKPGFQDDPEWQRKTAEIHKIMDENRRRNEAELRKEEEERARTVTK